MLFICAILVFSLSDYASAQVACYNSTTGTSATGCSFCTITVTVASGVASYAFGCAATNPVGAITIVAGTTPTIATTFTNGAVYSCTTANCNFVSIGASPLHTVASCNMGSTPTSTACPSGACAITYSTSATSGVRSYTYTCASTQCGAAVCTAGTGATVTSTYANNLADGTHYCINTVIGTACNLVPTAGITCLVAGATASCTNTATATSAATACSVTQATSGGVKSMTYGCNTANTCMGTINAVGTTTGLVMGADGTYCCTALTSTGSNPNCNFIRSTTSGAAEGAVVRTAFATNALLFVTLAVARMLNV